MGKRYGFIYVDKANEGNGTLNRYRKGSFYWYKEVITSNGKTIEIEQDVKKYYFMEEYKMKKALIICAGGMSSSLLAKKVTEYLKGKDHDVEVDAVSASEGGKKIENSDFALFLVSPQTKMYYQNLKKAGDRIGKPVVNIPPQAYVPIPMGIEKLGDLILQELPQ